MPAQILMQDSGATSHGADNQYFRSSQRHRPSPAALASLGLDPCCLIHALWWPFAPLWCCGASGALRRGRSTKLHRDLFQIAILAFDAGFVEGQKVPRNLMQLSDFRDVPVRRK